MQCNPITAGMGFPKRARCLTGRIQTLDAPLRGNPHGHSHQLDADDWKLAAGSWPLEAGRWKRQREAGSWKLEAGSWEAPSYSYLSASIGSSREALKAGNRPKKMPTLAEKPMPSANDHQGSETGKPVRPVDAEADRAAEDDAEQPAGGRQEDGLDQELPEDLAAARAERLAHADLARALGDRDHHDRHHADAADHQRDRRDDDQRQERRLADLVPHLQDGVLRGQIEVVRFVELQAVADAHERLDLAAWRPRACPSRGTTAIMAVRKTAGLKLLALILAEPLSTLPYSFSCVP